MVYHLNSLGKDRSLSSQLLHPKHLGILHTLDTDLFLPGSTPWDLGSSSDYSRNTRTSSHPSLARSSGNIASRVKDQ